MRVPSVALDPADTPGLGRLETLIIVFIHNTLECSPFTLPDEIDPDHDQWHSREGSIVGVREDDAGRETGDNIEYLVEFQFGGVMWFRWRDRPPAIGDCER